MGLYERRAAELLLTFNDEVSDGKELAWYLPRLTQYVKKCDALLTSLVASIKSFDEKDPREAAEWAKVRDAGLAEAVKEKPDLSKYGELPSVALLAFDKRFQVAEAAFLGGFKESQVGDEADAILGIARSLREKTEGLEKVWAKTLDQDEDFDDKAQATAKEVSGLIDEAISKAAANNRELIEAFGELVKINDSLPEGLKDLSDLVPGALGTVVKVILKALASSSYFYAKLLEKLLERERKLQDLFRREGNLMVVFSETRKEVAEFVRNTNLDKAKVSYIAADKELDTLIGAMEADTHEAAAEGFKKEVMEALGKVLDRAETHHNEFVKKHKSKFFGPVGSDIAEQLLETRVWSDLLRDFETRPLHTKLQELYSKRLFAVTAGKLEPAARDYIEDQLKRDFDKLMKVIEELDRKLERQPPEKQIEAGRKLLAERVS